MPDRIDHSALMARFDAVRACVEGTEPTADLGPDVLRACIDISREADAIRERSPRNVLANHIGEWMREQGIPTTWRVRPDPEPPAREAIIEQLANADPVGVVAWLREQYAVTDVELSKRQRQLKVIVPAPLLEAMEANVRHLERCAEGSSNDAEIEAGHALADNVSELLALDMDEVR